MKYWNNVSQESYAKYIIFYIKICSNILFPQDARVWFFKECQWAGVGFFYLKMLHVIVLGGDTLD